jgi:hypothetical protein
MTKTTKEHKKEKKNLNDEPISPGRVANAPERKDPGRVTNVPERNDVKRNDIGKTRIFYSILEHDKENPITLVRTGIPDKFNILTSLVYATSKSYINMNKERKEKMIKKLYSKIMKKMFTDFYHGIETSKFNYEEIKNIYENLENKEIYKIITEIVPLKKIVVSPIKNLKKSLENLDNSETVELYEKKKFCISSLEKLITLFENNKVFLSKIFKVNIFEIDSNSRMLVKTFLDKNKYDTSVILLKFQNKNDSKYEVVGKLLSGNYVLRKFKNSDNLVKKIKIFLYYPDLVKDQYPELQKFVENKKEDIKDNSVYNLSEDDESNDESDESNDESDESNDESDKNESNDENQHSESQHSSNEPSSNESSESRNTNDESDESDESKNESKNESEHKRKKPTRISKRPKSPEKVSKRPNKPKSMPRKPKK